MPKVQTITTNFTAGVFSPRLRGRVDIDKYNSSMRDGSNVVVLKHGGVTGRPSLDYKGTISDQSVQGRLLPFIYSNTTSYKLEFGNLTVRIWKDGALVTSGGSPVSVVTPFTSAMLDEMDFTQSGDTMILAHPSVPLQRLRRFGDAVWQMDEAPLDPGPIADVGHRAAIAMTLSAATVGTGRTITAASAFFRRADIGREFSSGAGRATITGYTSQAVVTAEITLAFSGTALAANAWLLEASPQGQITPNITGPVGMPAELAGNMPMFRSSDVGKYIDVNGGLVEITTIAGIAAASQTHDGDGAQTTFAYGFQILLTDEITVKVGGVTLALTTDYTLTGVGETAGGTVVFVVAPVVGVANIEFSRATGIESRAFGRVVRELIDTVAAPADAWALKSPVWNAQDGYPSTCTFFQQRLWAGNSSRWPNSKWGSRSGLYFDFLPGPEDDDAVYKTIDSKQATPIRFLHGAKSLVALTDSSEYDVRGGVEKPITQSNTAVARQSKWGCHTVKPEEVGDNILFAQRGGKVIRAMYPLDIEGFSARDISIYSEHLVQAGITGMSFQQGPESVCWCTCGDGSVVALTYSIEQNIIALAPMTTDGEVESVCTVPEGTTDATYLIVKRTIGGATKRYVEKLNWNVNPGMDSRAVGTGGPSTWSGFTHLEGKQVTVLADGIAVGLVTVSGGNIVLPNSGTATTVSAGLPYTPSITLQEPEVGTSTGTAQGQSISTNRVTVRLLETVGCRVNDQDLPWEQFGTDPLDGTIAEFTGDKDITEYGWSKGETPATISQPQPYPWTVLAVIREVTVNAG